MKKIKLERIAQYARRSTHDDLKMVWVEIDLKALKHNLNFIRRRIKKSGAAIMAIVKADAYGHGMKEVSKALYRENVSFFGVATLEEAVALRKILPKPKILVLGSFHRDQAPFFIRHRIIPTISSLEDAQIFNRAASGHKPFSIHVKIDTGMGRLGIWHEEAALFFKKLRYLQMLFVEGIYTHFANADHSNEDLTRRQIDYFNRAVNEARMAGLSPKYFHAANSMGLVRFNQAHLNLVRPGILLYGINPNGDAVLDKHLKPVLALKARLSFIKNSSGKRCISYGSTYQTTKPTRIGTLSIGYSHGYRVGFSNKANVLIRGKSYPIAGRVTMDQTLVDLGTDTSTKRWDTVTLIGQDGKRRITANELAIISQTIPYEITCSISSRISRTYIN